MRIIKHFALFGKSAFDFQNEKRSNSVRLQPEKIVAFIPVTDNFYEGDLKKEWRL